METMTKKTYVAPEIKTYGTVKAMTTQLIDKVFHAKDGKSFGGESIGPASQVTG